MARSSRQKKRYFRALEDIAHTLINEDGPAVNYRRRRDAPADTVTETSLLAATDAGMHALWNPSRFTGITDYQTWEDALLDDDDITEHVRAGKLVPINIGG